MSALLLGGCSTLPSSGPTGARVVHDARQPNLKFPYTLIQVRDAVARFVQ